MGQSTYSLGPSAAAFAGQLGDSGPHRIEAYVNGSGAQLPAGIAVVLSATDTVTTMNATGDQIAGFVLNQFARDPDDLTGTNAIQIGDDLNVLAEGAVWALAEEAMAVTDKVYVRFDSGTGTQMGAVRNDTDSATCRRLSGARVLRACSAAGPVLIYFSAAADASNL